MIDKELYQLYGQPNIKQTTDEVVYHYTSIYGLEGIIENKEIWITRSDFLNDASELLYFADLVIEIIDSIRVTESMDERFLNLLYQNYVSHFQVAYPQRFYILSLSKNKDALSMWNYYGKDDGYCIGIDHKEFMSILEDNHYTPIEGYVLYNSNQQSEILIYELEMAYDYWVKKCNSQENKIHGITDTIFARWIIYALFFKHPAYYHEEEYRIVLPHKENLTINFRPSHGVFSPYIVIPTIDEHNRFPLESITISPYIKHNRAIQGVREWLRQKEYTKEQQQSIYPSTINIRF